MGALRWDRSERTKLRRGWSGDGFGETGVDHGKERAVSCRNQSGTMDRMRLRAPILIYEMRGREATRDPAREGLTLLTCFQKLRGGPCGGIAIATDRGKRRKLGISWRAGEEERGASRKEKERGIGGCRGRANTNNASALT
jgi:hypothetical protein